jgi:hypothetical protein
MRAPPRAVSRGARVRLGPAIVFPGIGRAAARRERKISRYGFRNGPDSG